ncbi:MAG: Flp family type IVb pilin [Aestuariivirga sp.]|uniref:Flp family type IVb pilin n=1 Tax=Aestuariivirga sp. TaxID=2650926 RepID=UPI0038D0A04C
MIRKSFFRNESGATAIEYSLIAALVSLVIVTGMATLGDSIKTTFTGLSSRLAGKSVSSSDGGGSGGDLASGQKTTD